MKNYKYVLEWSEEKVNEETFFECLDYAWRYTPSKNNFMNYNAFVLGQNQQLIKETIYYKCLQQQSKANGKEIKSQKKLQKYEQNLISRNLKPFFWNVKHAPILIIYTQRVEKEMNNFQKRNTIFGMKYEQTYDKGTMKYDNASLLSRVEVGMFSNNLATKCLENGIDVSYVGCFPTALEKWREPEFDLITDSPILIQLIGHGQAYRRDNFPANEDLKPDFSKVVKFI